MKKQYLEAGKIVNTHGIRGDVKIQTWTNSPDFLCTFKTVYIDGAPVKLISAKVHKDCVLAALEGVADIDAAIRLKNKIVFINRDDVVLPDGEYFVQDLIGLPAFDADTGEELGKLTEVLSTPAGNIYVITGSREILVPAVPEFVVSVDIDDCVRLRLIEGM